MNKEDINKEIDRIYGAVQETINVNSLGVHPEILGLCFMELCAAIFSIPISSGVNSKLSIDVVCEDFRRLIGKYVKEGDRVEVKDE